VVESSGLAKLGGLIVPSEALSSADTVVFYVGSRQEQLTSISLHMSQNMIISCSLPENTVRTFKGCESREYRERVGGYLRVKDAKIVGIIIGSMVTSQ
jgi:diphthamide biosynthesis enzyme Dph1/Dph2-like protein